MRERERERGEGAIPDMNRNEVLASRISIEY